MDRAVKIDVKNLVHTYKTGVTALKDVDLKIYDNDVLSIIGQNGSGKTTLVRHFNGLLKPTSGEIFLNGNDTKDMKTTDMARTVGYVFQNPNHQIFCTTVREELEIAPDNFGFPADKKKKMIDSVIELMEIGDILDEHPLTLDYTTKKIVTIASILAFKPEVLIMDEPTGGLDEFGRRMLTKIINLMHDEGHTVVMISHDMDYVSEISKRIVVMAEAQIIYDSSPKEVFDKVDILKRADIEPPQITQLDLLLDSSKQNISLTNNDFVSKYR